MPRKPKRGFFRRDFGPLKKPSEEQPSAEESVLSVLRDLTLNKPGLFPMSGINSFRLSPHLMVPYLFQCAEQETNLTYKRFKSHWRSCGLPFFLSMYVLLPMRETASISPYYQIMRYTMRQLLVPQTPAVYTYIVYILYTTWTVQSAIFSSHAMRLIDPTNQGPFKEESNKLHPFVDLVCTESLCEYPADAELMPSTIPLPSSVWSEWAQLCIIFKRLAMNVVKKFRDTMVHTEDDEVDVITLDEGFEDPLGFDNSLSPNLGPMSAQNSQMYSFDLDNWNGPSEQAGQINAGQKAFSDRNRKRIEFALQQCGKLRWLARSLGIALDPLNLQPMEGHDDFVSRTMTTDSPSLANGKLDLVVMLRRYNLSGRKVKFIPMELPDGDKSIVDVVQCISRMHRKNAFTTSYSDSIRPLLGRRENWEGHFGLDPLVTSTSVMLNPLLGIKEWADFTKACDVLTNLTIFHGEKRKFMKLKDKMLFPKNKTIGVFSDRTPEAIERDLRRLAEADSDDSPFTVALTKNNIEANMGPVIEPSGIGIRKSAKEGTATSLERAVKEMLFTDKGNPDYDSSLIDKLQSSLIYDDFPLTPKLMQIIANDLKYRADVEEANSNNLTNLWTEEMLHVITQSAMKNSLSTDNPIYDVNELDYTKLQRLNALAFSLKLIAQCHAENRGSLAQGEIKLVFRVLAKSLELNAQRAMQILSPEKNSQKPTSTELIRHETADNSIVSESLFAFVPFANTVLHKLYMNPQFMLGLYPHGMHYRTAILECLNQGSLKQLDFPPVLPLATMQMLPHWLSFTCQFDVGNRLKEMFAQLEPQWMLKRLQKSNEEEDVAPSMNHVAEVCGISMDEVKLEIDKSHLSLMTSIMSKTMKRGALPSLATSSISAILDHARKVPGQIMDERCMYPFMDTFHTSEKRRVSLSPIDALSDFAQISVSGLGTGNTVEAIALSNPFSLLKISSVLDMEEVRNAAEEHQAVLGGLFRNVSMAISDALEKDGFCASIEAKNVATWLTDSQGGWKNIESDNNVCVDLEKWLSNRVESLESTNYLMYTGMEAEKETHGNSVSEAVSLPDRLRISPCDWISEASLIISRCETLVEKHKLKENSEEKMDSQLKDRKLEYMNASTHEYNPMIHPILKRPSLRVLPINRNGWISSNEKLTIRRAEEDVDEAVNSIVGIDEPMKQSLKLVGVNTLQMIKVQCAASIGAFPRPLVPFLPFALSLPKIPRSRYDQKGESIPGWPAGFFLSVSATRYNRKLVKQSEGGFFSNLTLRTMTDTSRFRSRSFLAICAATDCLRILHHASPSKDQISMDNPEVDEIGANESEVDDGDADVSSIPTERPPALSLLNLHSKPEMLTVLTAPPEQTEAPLVSRFLTSEEANRLVDERKQKERKREQTKHEIVRDLSVKKKVSKSRGFIRRTLGNESVSRRAQDERQGVESQSIEDHGVSFEPIDPLMEAILQLENTLNDSNELPVLNEKQRKRSLSRHTFTDAQSAKPTSSKVRKSKIGDNKSGTSKKRLKADFEEIPQEETVFSEASLIALERALNLMSETIEKGSAVPQEVLELTSDAKRNADDDIEERGHEL